MMTCQFWISPSGPDVDALTGLVQTVLFGGPIAAGLGITDAASRRYFLPLVLKSTG
jgi:hypothetical protein